MAPCARKEWQIARICFSTTLVLIAGLVVYLGSSALDALARGDEDTLEKLGWLALTSCFMVYGNLLYQACIIGHFRRQLTHVPADAEALQALHDGELPTLAVLVPAYKEERDVMWQTLMAAALSEYGEKDIVLLIDDPFQPKTLEDSLRLEAARDLPLSLQRLFDAPAQDMAAEWMGFCQRRTGGVLDLSVEAARLSSLYDRAADWAEQVAATFLCGRSPEALPHGERFFHASVLRSWQLAHREMAEILIASPPAHDAVLERHYRRLSRLFAVRFSSFERKKYVNFSHEANKAMNLNGYLSVMGRHWVEEERADGWHLRETTPEEAGFTPRNAEYLVILDADSIILPDYMLRLVNEMQKPEFAKTGVMQCYPSAFPGIPKGIERMAGASIDLLFRMNQGHEYLGGPFWMGANAVVRRAALDEIARSAISEGRTATIYIQDGTVIEDTETTLALLHKGWRVYQYPARLAYFSSPPDFGALLIQRRRWANGGILLVPSLLRYIARAPKNLALARELFVRIDYLTWGPVGCLIGLVMAFVHFGSLTHSPWVLLTPLPCLVVQLRTLRSEGYGYGDALRLTAFGIMLGPVVMGGVLKSLQQAITGKKIPFARTPKVPSRTSAPALYALVELILPPVMIYLTLRYAATGSWAQATYTLMSAIASSYALLYFMGVRATVEDLFAGMTTRLRAWFHRAEVIPLEPRESLPPASGEVKFGA